jgi:DNA replication protein
MSTTPDRVLAAIERFVREGFVTIEDDVDAATGVRSERYDLSPLHERLVGAWEEETDSYGFARAVGGGDEYEPDAAASSHREAAAAAASSPSPRPRETAASRRKDLFTVFESEFARPLSPMEYETIVGWLDQDRYSDSLIMTALKEAVFAGKVHFRYIDRILMEWQRNRITTPEEAKAYTERFRGGR